MRVLLTEGNGLTSRQVATHLDRLGHHVEVLTPDPLCLARFTRHVRRLHRSPRLAADPLGWMDRTLEVCAARRIDLLFPTHEHGIVLAHQHRRLADAGVLTAVAPFASYARVFDKVAAHDTLTDLRIGEPPTVVTRDPAELRACPKFPVFVKRAVGNSSTGVTRVTTPEQLDALADQLATDGAFADGVLVQRAAKGRMVMAQGVFADGELVAFHANLRLREGADGSAAIKRSTRKPEVREQMAALGQALGWHGALSADVFVRRDAPPSWIDVNPRLVEPANAYRAGVDLVAAYVEVARGTGVGAARGAAGAEDAQPGHVTHQLLMSLLGAAQRGAGRRTIAAEVFAATRHRGDYAKSIEELTPVRGDARAGIVPAAVALALLARPSSYGWFTNGAAPNYALGADGWRTLRDARDAAGARARR
jgi:biotin carboxylase